MRHPGLVVMRVLSVPAAPGQLMDQAMKMLTGGEAASIPAVFAILVPAPMPCRDSSAATLDRAPPHGRLLESRRSLASPSGSKDRRQLWLFSTSGRGALFGRGLAATATPSSILPAGSFRRLADRTVWAT